MIDETKEADPQMSSEAPGSLWGARFESAMAPEMVELNQSLPVIVVCGGKLSAAVRPGLRHSDVQGF